MSNHNKIWTEKDDETLLEFLHEGTDVEKIAEKLGRSSGAIDIRIRKKKVDNKHNEHSEEDIEEYKPYTHVKYKDGLWCCSCEIIGGANTQLCSNCKEIRYHATCNVVIEHKSILHGNECPKCKWVTNYKGKQVLNRRWDSNKTDKVRFNIMLQMGIKHPIELSKYITGIRNPYQTISNHKCRQQQNHKCRQQQNDLISKNNKNNTDSTNNVIGFDDNDNVSEVSDESNTSINDIHRRKKNTKKRKRKRKSSSKKNNKYYYLRSNESETESETESEQSNHELLIYNPIGYPITHSTKHIRSRRPKRYSNRNNTTIDQNDSDSQSDKALSVSYDANTMNTMNTNNKNNKNKNEHITNDNTHNAIHMDDIVPYSDDNCDECQASFPLVRNTHNTNNNNKNKNNNKNMTNDDIDNVIHTDEISVSYGANTHNVVLSDSKFVEYTYNTNNTNNNRHMINDNINNAIGIDDNYNIENINEESDDSVVILSADINYNNKNCRKRKREKIKDETYETVNKKKKLNEDSINSKKKQLNESSMNNIVVIDKKLNEWNPNELHFALSAAITGFAPKFDVLQKKFVDWNVNGENVRVFGWKDWCNLGVEDIGIAQKIVQYLQKISN